MSDILTQIADKIGRLEAENAALKRENVSLIQFIENELGPIGEIDALLTAEELSDESRN